MCRTSGVLNCLPPMDVTANHSYCTGPALDESISLPCPAAIQVRLYQRPCAPAWPCAMLSRLITRCGSPTTPDSNIRFTLIQIQTTSSYRGISSARQHPGCCPVHGYHQRHVPSAAGHIVNGSPGTEQTYRSRDHTSANKRHVPIHHALHEVNDPQGTQTSAPTPETNKRMWGRTECASIPLWQQADR